MKTKRKRAVRCEEVTKHVCEHLDEQMDSPRCRQIRKHLQGCPDCTAYLDGLKKMIKLYRTTPNPHVPRSAHKKLFAVLKLDQ
jgi:predicted anti-sigma-YlaC factor YlaD